MKMCKTFFAYIVVKSGSIYVKPKPKWMILGPSYTYHRTVSVKIREWSKK